MEPLTGADEERIREGLQGLTDSLDPENRQTFLESIEFNEKVLATDWTKFTLTFKFVTEATDMVAAISAAIEEGRER